jgi:parallel beta-helix repeat protein
MLGMYKIDIMIKFKTNIVLFLLLTSMVTVHEARAQKSDVINISNFGAKGDGQTDNTDVFRKAVEQAVRKSLPLYIPKGDYLISPLEFSFNNLEVFGEGRILSYNSNHKVLLKINGDGNIIQGISFFEVDFVQELLNLNGSNNKVTKVKFGTAGKSKSKKIVYSDRLLTFSNVNGKDNIIDNCVFKNGRVGVCVNGSFKLKNSVISHNIIGVLVRPSGRNSEIYNNTISHNDVTGNSGNDGILAQRNVDNIHIHNNAISFSGEHGIYFQGSNSLIENNKIFNNKKSGIKLASYNDELFNASKDYYIGSNNIIRGNLVYNNVKENKTSAGIYLQAPLKNILVENNNCYNNYHGIRTTSVYSKRVDDRRTELNDITISNNKVKNNRGISLWIEGGNNINILKNEGDNLVTTTKGNNVKMDSFVLEKNIINKITLQNLNGGKMIDNEYKEIDIKKSNSKMSIKEFERKNKKK